MEYKPLFLKVIVTTEDNEVLEEFKMTELEIASPLGGASIINELSWCFKNLRTRNAETNGRTPC